MPTPEPITRATETNACAPRCTLCMRFHSVIVAVVVVVDVRYDCQSGRQALECLSSVTILPPPHFVWLMRTNKLVFSIEYWISIPSVHVELNAEIAFPARAHTAERTEKTSGADQIIINNKNNSISNFFHSQCFSITFFYTNSTTARRFPASKCASEKWFRCC